MQFNPFSWSRGLNKTLAGHSRVIVVLIIMILPTIALVRQNLFCSAYPHESDLNLALPRALD